MRREPAQRRPASKGFGLRERALNAEYTSGKLPLAGSKLRADAQEWSKLDSERENKMTDVSQPGWTRLRTATGRYEYQFQGEMPTVRGGQYEEARDYQFLVLDDEGWLYKIPVRLESEAAAELGGDETRRLRVAEAQFRAGLETYRPHQGAPYPEMDAQFSLNATRARELALKLIP